MDTINLTPPETEMKDILNHLDATDGWCDEQEDQFLPMDFMDYNAEW